MKSRTAVPAVNLLTVAGAIMEIARDQFAGMRRAQEAGEAVEIAAKIDDLVQRVRRR